MLILPTRLLRQIPRPEARGAVLSLGLGIFLLAIKFLAYFLTGSSAVFSDAMESIVNVAAAAVALYSLGLAHSPADREHPYGHGKIEFVSAGFEGGMILLAAFVIAVKTIESIVHGSLQLSDLGAGLALMGAATVINGSLGLYLIQLGRRQQSITLEADGHHLLSDALTSTGTLIALGIVKIFHWVYADPAIALILAFYIAIMGLRLLRRAAAGLMDEQDLGDEKILEDILNTHIGPEGVEPRICSFHKLRHRHSGRYHWVDFHIMVPATLTVQQGHDVASIIEGEIERALGDADATAHVEPCANAQCRHCGTVAADNR